MSWHFCVNNIESVALEACYGSIDNGTGSGCGDIFGYCDCIDGEGWGSGFGYDGGNGIGSGYGFVGGDGLTDDFTLTAGNGFSSQAWR